MRSFGVVLDSDAANDWSRETGVYGFANPDAITMDKELWLANSLVVEIGAIVVFEILDPPGIIAPFFTIAWFAEGKRIINDHVVVTPARLP